jgi:Immunity protein Imm1
MFELYSSTGFTLTVGIDGHVGVAQHAAANGDPPYMVTSRKSAELNSRVVAFRTGGELTEVSAHYCLPMCEIDEVVREFVRTGKRLATVQWEEI